MDEDRFFILNRGNLEKRLDPFYYIPSLVALEEQVLANNAVPLRSFVKKMASGATPTVAEFNKYYSNAEEGHPFIRVQNLSETGVLSLDDVKYVNDFTQNVYLKRSQVGENDLVTKITGVGRMAVSSVPPIGFKGNINQHSVVIKTESREISEYLAAYLNSDIGEKLATRRSTGGTRPALDYPALRSIPVICNEEIFNKAREAREEREQKENQAKELLASIDDYLLTELGINLPPEPENTIENRKFRTTYAKVFGDRIDPFYNQDYFYQIKEAVKNSDYPAVFIKDTMQGLMIKGYLPKQEEKEGDNKVVQINSINRDGTINLDDLLTAQDVFSSFHKLKLDDILVVITGATIGKIGYWNYQGEYYLGGDIVKFQTEPSQFDPFYVYAYLRSKPSQIEIKRNITGATNGHLAPEDVKHVLIPKPPIEKQREIAEVVKAKTQQAYQLQIEALNDFQQAKREIEQLILNP